MQDKGDKEDKDKDKEKQDKAEMDQASLASIHESKTLAGIFQHIVDDCRVIKKIEMMIRFKFGNNNDDHPYQKKVHIFW